MFLDILVAAGIFFSYSKSSFLFCFSGYVVGLVAYDPKYRTFPESRFVDRHALMPLETCTTMTMFVLVLQSLNVSVSHCIVILCRT